MSNLSTGGSPAPLTGLKAVIEDHALVPVPAADRRSGWGLLMNTAGVGTALVVLATGGAVSYMAGTAWGLAVGIIAAVFGSLLGYGITRVCQVAGTSSTVTSRFYGLGYRGSALASLVFAFMVLGFLALENALLYYGTLFMFGWAPTPANAAVIYGVLTVAWILLATFGIKIVQRTSAVLTVVTLVLIVAVAGVALGNSTTSFGDIMAFAPEKVGFAEVTAALSAIAGIAGALALTGADFGRFARTAKDVRIMTVAGSIIVNVVVLMLGTIIFQAGNSIVIAFLENPDNFAVAATQAGATTQEKLDFMTHSNMGAYFIVLAGILGFGVMYAAQAKAQVINTYSGSLALSNLSDAVFGKTPGRLFMVVIGNVIGLLAIMGNILSLIGSWLGLLGIVTTALCTLIIADYFVVRRRTAAHPTKVENYNWAGIIALVAGSAAAYLATVAGVTSMGFLVALVVTAAVYIPLRLTVLKEGTGTGTVDSAAALQEVEGAAAGH